ncbi:hypothetical protein [Streptomyces sp. NPDC001270]|uniref:hypothetical protein n=1 Tax=Streptomyces sp. NPDC001270 TaxID=3364554 RepID=UPI0036863CFD
MAFAVWQPGMTITAQRANLAAMIGAVVFAAARTTGQTIPSGTETAANALQWDSIDVDLLSGWSAANPSRWTVPVAGLWTLSGAISVNGTTTPGTTRDALWYVNGGALVSGRARTYAESGISSSPLTVEARTITKRLAAGDYVELVPAHNANNAGTAVSLPTATGTFAPYANVTYAGPAN